jgi:hypothetical protein
MSSILQQRAADLGALKRTLKRKKARLARAEKALGASGGSFRRDLVTPKREYWRKQVKILETAISKAEGSGKAQKGMLK